MTCGVNHAISYVLRAISLERLSLLGARHNFGGGLRGLCYDVTDTNQLGREWQYDVTDPNQLGRECQYYVTDPNQLRREWQYYLTNPNQYSMSSFVYSKNPLYKKYMVME